MSKKSFFISFFVLTLSLVISFPALAQDENMGPPADIPDTSQFGPPSGQQMGPSDEQIQAMQKQGEEQQRKGQEKQLKGMKQGAKGMETALTRFEKMASDLEKKGMNVSAIKEKLGTVRQNIETIKSAQTVDEIQNVDQDAMQETMRSLGDYIGNYQKMQGLKKMLASMERGVASFEKRLSQLVEKQGITVPEDIKTDLTALKTGLQTIKDAKSPEELDAADPDTLGDLMTKVNESRPRLEMLAKWPRILKQADQQIKQFQNQLAKTKVLVDRLNSKGIDVSANYNTFEQDVNNLKVARDAADALMKEGQSEEAFNKMEDEFFNKLDDVGEHQRVIQMMSNLSRFNIEFKRGMASAQNQIRTLTRRKIDASEIQSIYNQALAKGNEIVTMIKTKPIDEEAILSAMDTMESLKQDFQNKFEELSGGQTMPWETKSPSQFQNLTLPKGFESNIPKLF